MNCVICQKEFTEPSCNAWPVKVGRCCWKCDDLVVIPERMIRCGVDPDAAKVLAKALHKLSQQLRRKRILNSL